MNNEPLSRSLTSILTGLIEAGGSADLDMHGRLIAGDVPRPLAGDSINWMVLVSRGLVAGENGKIIATQAGRQAANNPAGRVRVAAN